MKISGLNRLLTEATISLALAFGAYGAEGKTNLSEKIIPGGHFTWAEATKNGERMPENAEVKENIKKTAQMLEEIRSYFGNKPIKINSWYRPVDVNRAAGGKDKSEHLRGNAVDIVVEGVSPAEVYDKLNEYWGSRGGVGKYPTFTHVDSRGFKARWERK